ncbi:MAG: hypothetical protein AAF583_04860 [Pseudomonadota bacterium]
MAKKRKVLNRRDDPKIYKSINVTGDFFWSNDKRVRVKVFQNRIRVHYKHYNPGTYRYKLGFGMNEIYIRAEEHGQTVVEYWDDVRAGSGGGGGGDHRVYSTQLEAASAHSGEDGAIVSVAEFDPDDVETEDAPDGPDDTDRLA